MPSPPTSPLTASTASRAYPYGLRDSLLFRDPIVYYLAILLNLVLRFTWSLKLSTHLHVISELESGVFMMELLELVRRWAWVFFRVEWEVVRKGFTDRDEMRSGRLGGIELFNFEGGADTGGTEASDYFAHRSMERLRTSPVIQRLD